MARTHSEAKGSNAAAPLMADTGVVRLGPFSVNEATARRLEGGARSPFAPAPVASAGSFGPAQAGLALAGSHQSITAVWPPTGVAIAAVLLFGYRIWPAVTAGAFLANITTAGPFLSVVGISIGNTLEALVGAYLLLSVVGFDRSLDRVRDVVSLLGVALVASMVSATIGVASLWAGDVIQSGDLWSSWRVWWLGDATGALIFVPA